jgi:hypothetical protein
MTTWQSEAMSKRIEELDKLQIAGREFLAKAVRLGYSQKAISMQTKALDAWHTEAGSLVLALVKNEYIAV